MKRGLVPRLFEYQKERFPLAAMLPMSLSFSFSAVAYSRLAAGRKGFIPLPLYAVGASTALVTLFMLRVLDEHKDRDIDARFRKELPVPRGLVSLAELRLVGGGLALLAVALNAIFTPALLPMVLLIAVYAALMTKEFFVSEWLRGHLFVYLLTHMAILPIIDVYTTALDWRLGGRRPAPVLGLFLAVTFMNGVVVEIGRKLRAPAAEKEGVETYSKAWGLERAAYAWMGCLVFTAGLAVFAGRATGLGLGRLAFLALFAAASLIFGFRFLKRRDVGSSKAVESVSGVWTLVMYLWLGMGPYVFR